jgi:hypothetical protein
MDAADIKNIAFATRQVITMVAHPNHDRIVHKFVYLKVGKHLT